MTAMRRAIVFFVVGLGSSIALGDAHGPATAPAKRAGHGNWSCYMGVTGDGRTVEVCERGAAACEADRAARLAGDDKWQIAPKPCFAVRRAAVFTVRRAGGGKAEVFAVPEMEACEFLRAGYFDEGRHAGDRVGACRWSE